MLVALVASASFAVSCNRQQKANQNELKKLVEKENSSCPIQRPPFGTLNSVDYDQEKNEVSFNLSVNDAHMDFSFDNKEHEKLMKESFGLVFVASDAKEFLKHVKKAEASVAVVLKSNVSGKRLTLSYSPKEVADIYSQTLTDEQIKRKLLEINLKMAQSSLPMNLGDGMLMKSISLDGDVLVYSCELQESAEFMVPQIKGQQEVLDEVKEEMRKELYHDAETRSLIESLRELGYGMKYVYVGDLSDDSFEITWTPEELKAIYW